MSKKYYQPFIEAEPISNLPVTTTLEPGNMLLEAADGTTKKISTEVFYQLLHKIAVPITTADAGPFVANSWYKPMTYSADPGTNYPNAGNLKAIEGYDTLFFYTGTAWQKYFNKFPQAKIDTWTAATYPAGKQVFNEGKIYEAIQDVLATDVPGVSSKWKEMISGGDINTKTALKYFLEQPVGNPVIDLDFNLQETGNPPIYGVSVLQNAILRADNTTFTYSESGKYFYVYKNIALRSGNKKITKIDLSIHVIGNSSGGNNCNLIGIKADGSTTALISYPSPTPPTSLQTYSFDVSAFTSVSIGFVVSGNPGSLDQHAKFYKSDLGATENNVLNLINTKASRNNDIDLIEFGCAGDGVTDDTVRFNAAIALAMETGRRVYGRSNTYKVSRLVVPKTTTWKKIEIYGDGLPMLTCGTIGTLADYSSKQKGMVIISDYSNPDEGVIFAEPQPNSFLNFSLVYIALRNMVIRTTDNPKTCGVMAYYAIQLLMENVFVDTGIYNVQSAEPTTVCAGIVVPGHSNGAMNYLRNVWVAGYYSGLVVFEHTDGDNLIFHSCKNALTFKFAEHASYFKRVLSQRCTNVVNVEAKCRFEISQLNCEYVGSGQSDSSNAWQKTQYELKDPQNLGVGRITYANSRGVTGANEVFRMTGGTGVIVKYIGSDTRLTGAGVPDPNPIT